MEPEPPTDADLADLLDRERGGAAARSRSSRRWLRQQALEEARLSGVLLSAAEQRTAVTIRTTSGRSHTGEVVAFGADFCALRTAGLLLYVRSRCLTMVVVDPAFAAPAARDHRPAPEGATLTEVLTDHAPDRPQVSIVSAGDPHPVGGTLLAVGVDVLSVALDGRRGVAYVPLASVSEVSLRASG